MALALLGIAVGLLLGGAGAGARGAAARAACCRCRCALGVYPGAARRLPALFGLLTTLVFALWPLAGIGRVPPGALFRDTVDRRRAVCAAGWRSAATRGRRRSGSRRSSC